MIVLGGGIKPMKEEDQLPNQSMNHFEAVLSQVLPRGKHGDGMADFDRSEFLQVVARWANFSALQASHHAFFCSFKSD